MAIVTRKRVETAVVAVLAVALGVLAVVHRGVPASDVELNDGGIWVTNQSERLVGHLNYESETIDGAIRSASSSFDVTQSGTHVLSRSSDTVQPVDVASVSFQGEAGVSGVLMAHGADQVLFADQAGGRVWAHDVPSATTFSLTAEPQLKDLATPRIAVGTDGTGYVLSGDGHLYTVRGNATEAKVSDLGVRARSDLTEKAQVTVVGDQFAVLDGFRLSVGGREIEDSSFEQGVLQQPSAASASVVIATPTELLRVDIASGRISRDTVNNGQPVAPVQLEGCIYGLWSDSGYYVRDCGGDDYEESQFPELANAKAPVFRTNRKVIVINDAVTGDVFLPLRQMKKVDNWEQVASQLRDEERQEEDTEEVDETQTRQFSDEQHPPQAMDDELGARPGTSTTLPILLNDVDLDGDVLTTILRDVPDGVKVSLTKQGRAVRIEVPADATGSVSFTYQAYDGIDSSNVAKVTVNIRSEGENSPPKMVRENTVNISERSEASYSVLSDWVDPDGDPIFLQKAESEEGFDLTWRPDGFVSVKDLGQGGPGRRSVNLTVSDGRDASTGVLNVQVSPGSTNSPPVANNDHFVATVGEPITLNPRGNDTDPDSDPLKFVELSEAPAGVQLTPDYQEGNIRFQAAAAGSYTLIYGISDGPNTARGRIRVDVIDPKAAERQPVAEDDLGLLSANGSVVVNALANDYDPGGGVLVIQGYSLGDSSGLNVEVVRHSLLRITAPAGLSGPQTFTYTVSNGQASTTAKVQVVPQEAPTASQGPVTEPDASTVRAGDLVTIPVLSNDYSPSDLDISLAPEVDGRSDPALGEFFISENAIRFRAGAEVGTAEAIYTVVDANGARSSATVTVAIRELEERNQEPVPKPIEARTFAGSSVRINVPLDGIDPNGDSVTLVGSGDRVPQHGAVSIEGNHIVYQASQNATGTDVFTYRVQDRFGAEGVGTVRVGVAPAPTTNQLPVAVADEVSARPSTRLEIPATKNDIDPDGDQISIIKESVRPADSSWELQVEVKGQRIVVVTPAQEGTYQLLYSISDGRGISVQGAVTVTVDKNVPPVAPQARDDVVQASAISGVDTVDIPVLENDSDSDGVVSDMKVDVEGPATVRNGVVTVPVREDRQIILYTVTDADGLSARAAIVVPGRENPPQLNADKGPARVTAGETLTIDIPEWVLTRPGREAKLTSVDSVVAGPGGDSKAGDGGVQVVDGRTLNFTPDIGFSGVTTVSFEVTDGQRIDDPSGKTARINLTVQVTSSGKQPPQVRPNQLRVAPGEPSQTVSLAAMVDDPDPGDKERMTFELTGTEGPVQASVSGQELSLAAADGAAVGSTATVNVSVHDGSTDPVTMTIPVTVISSTRPLMTVPEITEKDARIGTPVSFNLAEIVTNPFADVGGEISLVGSPDVRGAATASAEGSVITVTPTEPGASDTAPEDITVTYRVADATKDPQREKTGVIRLVVKNPPVAPANVSAQYLKSQTARVSWTHASWRGGTPRGYLVSWPGGSQECGLQTTCDVSGLPNGGRYSFTVKALVSESDLNSRSPQSEPSNEILVDVLPDTPAAPTAVAGDQRVALTWNAGTVPSGGSPVTRYTVTKYPGGEQQDTTGTSLTWSGLSNGQAYTFTVSVHNRLTDSDSKVSPPVSPASQPVTPAGAPGNLSAPSVSMIGTGDGSQLAARISWAQPGASNGDTHYRYIVTDNSGREVCSERSETSCDISLTPSTEEVTFSVKATNSSGLWSAPSPHSEPVRAFQPPSAPTGFEVTPTGKGTEVKLNVWGASGNGLREDEISYRWSAGGDGGTVSAGEHVITSSAFALGQPVTVRVTAIATVKGQTSEGGSKTATVTAYAPPQAPTVSAEGGEQVTFKWDISSPSNGAKVTQVRLKINGDTEEVGNPSGSRTVGEPGQRYCLSAQAQNEHGDWGPWSQEACANTTKPEPEKHATLEWEAKRCAQGPWCEYEFRITLDQWPADQDVKCKLPYLRRKRGDDAVKVELETSSSGKARKDFEAWAHADDISSSVGSRDITAQCEKD